MVLEPYQWQILAPTQMGLSFLYVPQSKYEHIRATVLKNPGSLESCTFYLILLMQ